jgi:hypothetical protein
LMSHPYKINHMWNLDLQIRYFQCRSLAVDHADFGLRIPKIERRYRKVRQSERKNPANDAPGIWMIYKSTMTICSFGVRRA